MNAIVDALILGPEELKILIKKYPRCLTTNLTNTDQLFQTYRVIIEAEDEDDYYDFLVDKRIAMSSQNFYSRMRSDKRFASKMELRRRTIRGTED